MAFDIGREISLQTRIGIKVCFGLWLKVVGKGYGKIACLRDRCLVLWIPAVFR